MKTWSVGDCFIAEGSDVFMVTQVDDRDAAYVQVNNPGNNVPMLIVRMLDTLTYYEQVGQITRIGDIFEGNKK